MYLLFNVEIETEREGEQGLTEIMLYYGRSFGFDCP